MRVFVDSIRAGADSAAISHGSHGLRGHPVRERSAFRDAERRCPRSHAEHGNDDVLVAKQPSEAGSVKRIRQKIPAIKKENSLTFLIIL